MTTTVSNKFSCVATSVSLLLFTSLVLVTNSSRIAAERVSDKIYNVVQSNHYCSRRLNATHQMGCSSNLNGNLGIVWLVEGKLDLQHILKTGPTPPYVAVLDRQHYTRKNLLEFKQNLSRVAGVVFLDKDPDDSKFRQSSAFSPDDVCPNRHSGLYANDSRYGDCRENTWQWESPISGLLYDDIPYPIFLINDKQSTQDIQACFREHNLVKERDDGHQNSTTVGILIETDELFRGSAKRRDQDSYPLCGMQLDSFMLAAKDASLCLNSQSVVDDLLQANGRRCYLVDNKNIFAYYKPAIGRPHPINDSREYMKPDTIAPQSLVMLVARLSSISMFTEVSPGADSTITSIVSLLAIAHALGNPSLMNSTEVTQSNRNLAFALLDSEPFDYTGSSRMVYEMLQNDFPNSYFKFAANDSNATSFRNVMQNTNISSIDYVINLDQLANYPDTETLFVHTNPENLFNNEGGADKRFDELIYTINKLARSESVPTEMTRLPLPPTSVQQFIKASQNLTTSNRLIGTVLSNYGNKFRNLFYNGIYDDSHNIYQTSKAKLVEHLTKVSQFVARLIFELTFKTDKLSESIKVDKKLVEQLLDCYLVDAECELFTEAWKAGQKLPNRPIETYKDPTKHSDDMNGAITAHLLAYFIGDKMIGYNVSKCYEENRQSLTHNFEYVNGDKQPVNDGTSGVCIRSQVATVSATSPAFSYGEDGIAIDPKYPAWTVSLNSIRNPVRLYLKPSPLSEWSMFVLGIVVTIASILAILHVKATFRRIGAKDEVQTGTPT